MSKYTTEVRYICETSAGLTESVGYANVNEVIAKAIPKVFDFDFPIFDEAYRSVLQTKILKHYYTREIGAETVGLWKLWLDTKLNEIMPYYNKLYESELLEFNPLYDVDISREHSGNKVGNKTDKLERNSNKEESKNVTSNGATTGKTNVSGTDSYTNTHYDYYSDTPQGGVGNLEDLSYLTNARKVSDNKSNTNTSNGTYESSNNYEEDNTITGTNTETSSSNSVINNTEDYLEHVSGKQGGNTYASMLIEYRKTFLNIDMQVIEELEGLFMQLW